jgi:hypothetical protein
MRLRWIAAALAVCLTGSAALADENTVYVPMPNLGDGNIHAYAELFRVNNARKKVAVTFVPDGQSGVGREATNINVFIGPSTKTASPLIAFNHLAPGGGLVTLDPEDGLDVIETSLEIEKSPHNTAWELPVLFEDDFFAGGTSGYVRGLEKRGTLASTLQIFNRGNNPATCSATVLRPKGTPIEVRSGLVVPALGSLKVADILRAVAAPNAKGINVAVSCSHPFYALGSFAAPVRRDVRVHFPTAEAPVDDAVEVQIEHRPGTFLAVKKGASFLRIPLEDLEQDVRYRRMHIEFVVRTADPREFFVIRNLVGMFRKGGRRFNKTLMFGSFDRVAVGKVWLDVGTPFIETTLKREAVLQSGRFYHFSIDLDVEKRSMNYLVRNNDGGTVFEFQSGLYTEDIGRVAGEVPNLEFGLPFVADGAYYPPYLWSFRDLKVTATH